MYKTISFLFLPILFGCFIDKSSENQSSLLPFQKQSSFQEITIDNTQYEYSWLDNYSIDNKLNNRIALPEGYKRIHAEQNSFATWLRNIPLKKPDSKVYLYNGQEKWSQKNMLR